MTYSLIGSGNIAWLMASRMQAAGHQCVGVWSRNGAAAAELCSAFSIRQCDTLDTLPADCEACILAVSDSGISALAGELKHLSGALIHSAGSVSLDILTNEITDAGVVWPVYSIRKDDLPAHREFPVLIEASTEQAMSVVREIAAAISDTVIEADSLQRQWLHLAAVIGNNFVNQLLAMVADICAAQGQPSALLQPLIVQTVASAALAHPGTLQTGPARRHDTGTMAAHLQLLRGQPAWQDIYESLSKAIMNRFPQS